MIIKNTGYNLLKSLISLRKSIILLMGILLKRSFIDFVLKYFVRIWLNSAQIIRKCLTVKGSLQGIQNGACSFFNTGQSR